MEPFLKSIDKQQAQKAQSAQDEVQAARQTAHTQAILDTIAAATKALIAFQKQHQPKVSVTNQKLPTSIKTPDVQAVVKALENLKQPIQENKVDNTPVVEAIKELGTAVAKLPTEYPQAPTPVEEVTVKNQPDYSKQFDSLGEAIKSIDVKPVINIPEEKPDDYTPIIEPLNAVLAAVQAIKIPAVPKTDLSPLLAATQSVQETIANLRFPVANYVLPFKDTTGKAAQVLLDASGNVPVTATLTEVTPATVVNGKKTVTTAGTRVSLASSTTVKSVTIKALAANTGTIYIGDSAVSASNGFALAAGDTVSLDISNLSTINLDSSVNGEGVTFIAVN